AGDLLVLNDSRVIPARLFARRAIKPTSQNRDVGHRKMKTQEPSGEIEVLLTEQVEEEGANVWNALVRPGRKVRVGERLEFFASNEPQVQPLLTAEVIATGERGERTLRFAPVADFNAVLARIGHMPLPPYIRHGRDEAEDRERYQTVYAHEPGSAAAPTAGLHFTPEILDALGARGVEIAYLTLHVGLGTFQPVRVERVEDVRLHSERYTLPEETANALKRALRKGRRVIAVGTTTTRTLEHIAREAGADVRSIPPRQGFAGAPESNEFPKWIEGIAPHSGETSIFIAPGHKFRIVSGLLTNFHLPESTLLMLISAFAADHIATSKADHADCDMGRRVVLAAYGHAVRQRYRFYSYGDCMLLL
ncbi:MAG TPA: tRNA preQ1(34) S-adenosylmethionine ribosyltransferase-isomerase QueA, partial [Acidobacteriaceae bacterium]|nr:tRNA preQ1(34) S-adenosylmethionine ribosyltransferase-isomerase QueA [Acidobacteriaceae bacterium]